MMGPQPVNPARNPERAAAAAGAAGLEVVDLRQEALRTVFNDVGAVVYFLRKVIWTVPGFTSAGVWRATGSTSPTDPNPGTLRRSRPAILDRSPQAALKYRPTVSR